MNLPQVQYAIDADVLMAAHHHHYAPDLCPGFWNCLEYYFQNGRLVLIDRVQAEITSPTVLVDWVDQSIASGLVAATNAPSVVATYQQMSDWVRHNPQYLPAALDGFARAADGWLAAYARVHGLTLVTNEASAPNARNRVPLPELCSQFGVHYINTFNLLRELGVQFAWQQP